MLVNYEELDPFRWWEGSSFLKSQYLETLFRVYIYSFNEVSLSSYFVPYTILDNEVATMEKTQNHLSSQSLPLQNTENKKNGQVDCIIYKMEKSGGMEENKTREEN